ncbi:hypothetical protein FRE64_02070 [Euhalothece natronophila Z-M001]|uniref:Uncharacterized protein n=1 Tax=Euhalothece natronophila Z-M001 TaxID=522448 RepID=A0A5B8NIP0_9CHRO|nr:hypothetical protein [Euhalothece natronophila]QDZ38827.1 hypothetical protein FRE64_02070 [Euhalothece natronophila Z-M001]
MTDNQRQDEYFELIDRLLQCPNGKEPEVLEGSFHLVDQEFIKTLIQVATAMAHDDNQQSAQFLMFIARELSKQLGFYPDFNNSSSNQEVDSSVSTDSVMS